MKASFRENYEVHEDEKRLLLKNIMRPMKKNEALF